MASPPADNASAQRAPENPPPADGPVPGTYEQARDQLTEVVHRLEAGGVSLEESLALWERGEELADACQQWLDGARARLDEVRTSGTGPQGSGPQGPGEHG
ncbi:MAG: exodeoxyribonuclease VII small subunit [Actinomycetes bacterium]